VKNAEKYAAVVVNRKIAAVDRIFHYTIPEDLSEEVKIGSVVSIPFGHQFLEGIVVDLPHTVERKDLKPILSLVSPRPLFSRELLLLSRWMADTYLCPWVTALQAMLPAGLTLTGKMPQKALVKRYFLKPMPEDFHPTAKQRQVVDYLSVHNGATAQDLKLQDFSEAVLSLLCQKGIVNMQKSPLFAEEAQHDITGADLNPEQDNAYQSIKKEMTGQKRPLLLFGVTGSGKTEIYLRLIADMVAGGKQVILLVPEIALSPQMLAMMEKRLNLKIAVLHSALTQSQRRITWQKIAQSEYSVVMGARSAIFAPVPNLGLIIIDEEQEGGYKQDHTPCFHALEVAKERCRLTDAFLLLGSATPSVESYYHTQLGTYALATLEQRYYGAQLPQTAIVDMRQELRNGNRSIFSDLLKEEIALRLEQKEQVLLFLNRRGYHTFFSCRSCGHVIVCPHCAIPMTYHQNDLSLKCHYCGKKVQPPKVCPACGSNAIRFFGTGTQRVEQEIKSMFPQANVARLDYDVAEKRGSRETIYQEMQQGKIDILVGTQMIAKGLDFANVTLAAIIAADLSLFLPDWRASERTYQLITQMVGRAGRREKPGFAVIQTYHPDSAVVQAAAAQDYFSFYQDEIENRKAHFYPPFSHLLLILLSSCDRPALIETAAAFSFYLEQHLQDQANICGPSPASWEKMKDRYRRQILIKGQDAELLRQAVLFAEQELQTKQILVKDLLIHIEPDPMSIF